MNTQPGTRITQRVSARESALMQIVKHPAHLARIAFAASLWVGAASQAQPAPPPTGVVSLAASASIEMIVAPLHPVLKKLIRSLN